MDNSEALSALSLLEGVIYLQRHLENGGCCQKAKVQHLGM